MNNSKEKQPGPVTMIFPHKQSEIGLQQRATIFVKTTEYNEIPLSLQVRVVDLYGADVALCPKKKKDHDCVIKTLNEEFYVGGAKTDVTFYCKGANTGGCKTKKPSQYRLYITLYYHNGTSLQFLSSVILVRGNRRVRKETTTTNVEETPKYFQTKANGGAVTSILNPKSEESMCSIVGGKDLAFHHSTVVSFNTESERMMANSTMFKTSPPPLEINPFYYLNIPGKADSLNSDIRNTGMVSQVLATTPSGLFNPIILPGAHKLLGSAFSLKRPTQEETNHLRPPKKMNINNLVNQY